jgi:hypothetical protein
MVLLDPYKHVVQSEECDSDNTQGKNPSDDKTGSVPCLFVVKSTPDRKNTDKY